MAERRCMICGQPCGLGGFGQLCETCWGGPIRTPEGAMPPHIGGQIFCEGNPGHGPITVAAAKRQDEYKMRYRPDGSTERVKHPGRVIVLPPSLGGR